MNARYVHSDRSEANELNFASVRIEEYPRLTEKLGFARFSVDGRRPSEPGKAYLETDCTFSLFVLSGSAKMRVEHESFPLKEGDLVTVTAGTPWSLEGKIEYVVAT